MQGKMHRTENYDRVANSANGREATALLATAAAAETGGAEAMGPTNAGGAARLLRAGCGWEKSCSGVWPKCSICSCVRVCGRCQRRAHSRQQLAAAAGKQAGTYLQVTTRSAQ